jgi:hypothetical protein
MQKTRAMQKSSPFFVVGMPRSGTKLLRSLLKNHPDIFIPSTETGFLPYWVSNWARFSDIGDVEEFREFYRWTLTLPFFIYRREKGKSLGADEWYSNCSSYDPAAVFMGLLKSVARQEKPQATVLGDKSPSYINHLDVLKELFPDAVVIHIIRDVRDHVLSFNKAYGKHPLRAAQRWDQGIKAAWAFAARHGHCYCEVLYEDLLENPQANLVRICEFLGVPYHQNMEQLRRPTENEGDAKGYSGIKKDNKGKYVERMPEGLRNKIEMLTVDTLKSLGYPVTYSGKKKRLSAVWMTVLQLTDCFRLFKRSVASANRRKSLYLLMREWSTTAKLDIFRK